MKTNPNIFVDQNFALTTVLWLKFKFWWKWKFWSKIEIFG